MPNQKNNEQISVKISATGLIEIAKNELALLNEITQDLIEKFPTKEDPDNTILSDKGRGLYEAANTIRQAVASYNEKSLEEIKKIADEVFNDI